MLITVQHALPDNRWRLVALGGVLLIHLLIIAVLLTGMPQIMRERAAPRESFFVITPVPKPRVKVTPAPPAPSRLAPVPIFRWKSIPPNAITAPTPQIHGLGFSLLQCAAENLVNLSPEDRAHCRSAAAPSDDALPGTVREHAVDAATWSASIAKRNTPVRVPCTYITAIPEDVTTGRTVKVPMADAVCLLGLIKGPGH